MSGRARILHVDDDERILRAVARYLEEEGFLVVSTTSPFIAPIIAKEKPDVVVMDVDMPLLPGDRIVTILRRNEYASTPVIYFSGKPAVELATIANTTRPSAYVRKESGLPALAEKIRGFLSP